MRTITKIAAGIVLGLTALSASAAHILDIPVTGVSSWDEEGNGFNTIITIQLDAPTTITGIGWDVVISTVGFSWLNEATVGFGTAGGINDILLAPCATSAPGVEACSSGGIVNLAGAGVPDLFLADGMLQLEFFESFDDVPGAIDATWEGMLQIECATDCVTAVAVAEPGILVLFGLGLIGVVAARRRV